MKRINFVIAAIASVLVMSTATCSAKNTRSEKQGKKVEVVSHNKVAPAPAPQKAHVVVNHKPAPAPVKHHACNAKPVVHTHVVPMHKVNHVHKTCKLCHHIHPAHAHGCHKVVVCL